MSKRLFLGALYAGFLLWQNRWFSEPLSLDEVDAFLDQVDGQSAKSLTEEERDNFRAFLLADDGKPFYMVNLMEYRDEAVYPDGG